MLKAVISILFLLAFSALHAQLKAIPSHYEYVDDQLGSNTVFNLIEHKQFMYAATDDGIVRIGHGKTSILRSTEALKNSYTLLKRGPNDHIYALNFKNQIFKITDDGLELYKNLQQDFEDRIYSYEFFEGFMYVNSSLSLRRYHLPSLELDTQWSFPGKQVESELKNGTVYWSTYKLSGDDVIIDEDRYHLNRSKRKDYHSIISWESYNGEEFLCTDNFIYSNKTDEPIDWKVYLPKVTRIHYFKLLSDEKLWLSTNAGLLIIDPKDRSNIQVLFPGVSTSDMFIDSQGNAWVGTLGQGVKVIPDLRVKYYPFDEPITSFEYADANRGAYIGTVTGELYNWKGTKLNMFDHVAGEINSISANGNRLYISCARNHVYVNNQLVGTGLFRDKVDHITYFNQYVVFSSWYMNNILNPDLTKIQDHSDFQVYNSIFRKDLKSLSPLWIGEDGDYLLGLRNGAVVIEGRSTNQDELEPNIVDLKSFNDVPYLLTASGEVWLFEAESSKFIKLASIRTNGLCERLIVKENAFYIYENGIIHRLSRKGNAQQSFLGLSRFAHEELIEFKASGKTIFVVFRGGIHEVPMKALSREFLVQSFPLSLYVDNKLQENSVSYLIEPGEHAIVIGFNHFDELAGSKTRYSYKLNNQNWVDVKGNERLYLDGLSAGKYHIKVRVHQVAGDTIEKEISFEIRPYWYTTTWFFVSITLFIVLLVILYFYRRINHLKKRQMVEREMTLARLSKINAQMKPHFIFNVLTSIQSMILKEDRFAASNAIGVFAQFIRKTLDISRKEVIRLEQELEIAEEYIRLEKQRHIRSFDYSIQTEGLSKQTFLMEIPPLILQPYIENAIIHGIHHLTTRAGRLEIKLTEEDGVLKCVIEDNGVGRSYKSNEKKSSAPSHDPFANAANFNRIALIEGGKVYIDDLNEGTRVTLTIPLTR